VERINLAHDRDKLRTIANKIKNLRVQVEVFWVVIPCSVVVGYQRFRSP
jgi:hypothetical protein